MYPYEFDICRCLKQAIWMRRRMQMLRSGHGIFGALASLGSCPINILVWDFDIAGLAVDTAKTTSQLCGYIPIGGMVFNQARSKETID